MKFQKGDILRRNKAYAEHVLSNGAPQGRLLQLTELYECVEDDISDPLCIIVRSPRHDRLGHKAHFKAEWVEIAEYS